jgi:DNA-binding MarR family transcriptional regulator
MKATARTLEPAHPGLSVWIRIIKAYNLVLRKARSRLSECTLSQFDVVAHLVREKNGMTSVELSRRLLVTAGNITGLIDRMEKSGLVERRRHAGDRRTIRIHLTGKGRKLAERVIPKHSADIESIFAVLSDAEKNQLHKSLDKLIRSLEFVAPASRRQS